MSKCIDKEELKPCPFCGGEAEICSAFEDKFLGKYWYIRCKICHSRGSGIYESGKELEPNQEYEAIKGAWDKAIKAWNRRVSDDAGRRFSDEPCKRFERRTDE